MIKDLIENGNEEQSDFPIRRYYDPLKSVSVFSINGIHAVAQLLDGPHDVKFSGVEKFASQLDGLAQDWCNDDHWRDLDAFSQGVAMLDLKMVYTMASLLEDRFQHNYMGATVAGIGKHRLEMESRIREISKALGRAPVSALTYEDIVLNNPRNQPRTFLTGSAGRSEMAFYMGHQLIESWLADAIGGMKDYMAMKTGRKPEGLINAPMLMQTGGNVEMSHLRVAHQEIGDVAFAMRDFAVQLDSTHFAAFKPFFAPNPFTGEKGPSGAFSAKIPHVDILLYGKNLPQSTRDYLKENEPYFPTADLAAANASLEDGRSLIDIVCQYSDNTEARERCRQIAQKMVGFRRTHKGAVAKHIGKEVMGSAEGSGAAQFLDGRINDYQEAYEAANKRLLSAGPNRPRGGIRPGDRRFWTDPKL